jgi:hypothetical protein
MSHFFGGCKLVFMNTYRRDKNAGAMHVIYNAQHLISFLLKHCLFFQSAVCPYAESTAPSAAGSPYSAI